MIESVTALEPVLMRRQQIAADMCTTHTELSAIYIYNIYTFVLLQWTEKNQSLCHR